MTVNTGQARNSWGMYPVTKGTTTSVLSLKGLPRKRKRRKAGHRITRRGM